MSFVPRSLIHEYLDERTVERRNEVVAAYRYLCARGARKFHRSDNDRADLEHVAIIGLIKACEYYRSDSSTPFEAYAWMMIVGELMHYVRDFERIVRIPRWLRSLEKRYLEAFDAFLTRYEREPTVLEIACEMNVPLDIAEELRALRAGRTTASLDGGEGRLALTGFSAVEIREPMEDRIATIVAIEQLPERERAVVFGIYGLGLSQRELAGKLNVSQRYVSRILARALQRMAAMLV